MNDGGVPYDLVGAVEAANFRAEVRAISNFPQQELEVCAPTNILSLNILQGMATTYLSDATASSEVPLGPLVLWPRAARTRIRTSGRPALNVICKFYGDAGGMVLGSKPRSIYDPVVGELMRSLHDEIRSPGLDSLAIVKSIAEILRISLFRVGARHGKVAGLHDTASALGKCDVDRIRDYVEAQRGRTPSVKELARLCNLSRRSLLRRFQDVDGMTVFEFVKRIQMEKAGSLLRLSNMSVKQVAYEVGFLSPSNLSQAFKRSTGLTPTEYRTEVRGGQQ